VLADQFDDLVVPAVGEQGVVIDVAGRAGVVGQLGVEGGLLGGRLAGVGQGAAAEDALGLAAAPGLGELAVADLVDVALTVLAGGLVEVGAVLGVADEAAVLDHAAVVRRLG